MRNGDAKTEESRQDAIKTMLTEALDRAPGERERFVRESVGDPSIRAEVIELLEAYEDAGDFLGDPSGGAAERLSSCPDDFDHQQAVGTIIDRYELVQLIGEGGFGMVYRARQREPVIRDVALKIIKVGMDTRQVIARFEAERQALAVMEHPNIARVIDAGATAAGRPYFVMELVDGVPVTTYCDEHRLSIAARLELFSDVCEAVHHAHTKGVIHRDIKPSNVLVAQQDHRHVPKVIDFGIAKATTGIGEVAESADQPAPGGFRFTMDYGLIGTPAYMSPEQAAPSAPGASDIDTRTDVYSLGVLMYELLISVTPFDQERLRSSSFDEVQRILREEAPPNPSTRFSMLQSSAEAAAHRSVAPHRLESALHGDLDWIALKALDKDRDRRYASAAEFAEDLRRYLRHEPVIAGPPSALYRMKKFACRNRIGVLASCLVVFAIIAGLVGLTVGVVQARESAQQARESADQARDAAQQAQAVNDFMREVLTSANPDANGADVRLVEVLDSASETAPQRFAGQPELEAQVHAMLGGVFSSLSVYKRMEDEFRKAAALWQSCAGPDDCRTLEAMLGVAQALVNQQLGRKAEEYLGDIIPRLDRAFGPDHIKSFEGREIVSDMLRVRGRLEESEQLLRESLDRAAAIGIDELTQLNLLNSLADTLWRNNDRRELAIETARQLLERSQRRPDECQPIIANARHIIAKLTLLEGEFEEAAAQARALLEENRERLGECHAIRMNALELLADAENRLGRPAEAADLYAQQINCVRASSKGNSIYLLTVLASALAPFDRASRWPEGETCAREVVQTLKDLGSAHVGTHFYEDYLAHFISHQGRLDEAETLFQSLFERQDEAENDVARARLVLHYASHLVRCGQLEQAEEQLQSIADVTGDIRTGIVAQYPDDILVEFIALYTAWGKPDEVAKYEALRAESLEHAAHPE